MAPTFPGVPRLMQGVLGGGDGKAIPMPLTYDAGLPLSTSILGFMGFRVLGVRRLGRFRGFRGLGCCKMSLVLGNVGVDSASEDSLQGLGLSKNPPEADGA